MAIIDVEGFVKDYGSVRVLHEVDLHIADGEFVVLLGPLGLRQVHHAAHDRRA